MVSLLIYSVVVGLTLFKLIESIMIIYKLCSCGNCMPTESVNICCMEIEQVTSTFRNIHKMRSAIIFLDWKFEHKKFFQNQL